MQDVKDVVCLDALYDEVRVAVDPALVEGVAGIRIVGREGSCPDADEWTSKARVRRLRTREEVMDLSLVLFLLGFRRSFCPLLYILSH